MFEGGNVIDQGTIDTVKQFLTTHPTEAKAARSYT